jgi:hypothetical protein
MAKGWVLTAASSSVAQLRKSAVRSKSVISSPAAVEECDFEPRGVVALAPVAPALLEAVSADRRRGELRAVGVAVGVALGALGPALGAARGRPEAGEAGLAGGEEGEAGVAAGESVGRLQPALRRVERAGEDEPLRPHRREGLAADRRLEAGGGGGRVKRDRGRLGCLEDGPPRRHRSTARHRRRPPRRALRARAPPPPAAAARAR